MAQKAKAYVLEILTILGITWSDLFIIHCQKMRFYTSLFTQQMNLLSVNRIYGFAQRSIVVAAMLYMLGVACLLLCLVSYDTLPFLRCSRLFFFASGFEVSIWNSEFVFYSSRKEMLYWSRIEDICLVCFAVTLFGILQSECRPVFAAAVLRWANAGAGTVMVLLGLVYSQAQMLLALKCFFWYTLAYSVLFAVSLVKKYRLYGSSGRARGESGAPALLFGCAMMEALLWLVAYYKFSALSFGYAFCNGPLPYILLGAVTVFFLAFIQVHRMGIVFGGEANAKLKEIERHRSLVTASLVSYCFTPVNNLICYNRDMRSACAAGDTALQETLATNMERELYRLRSHLAGMNGSAEPGTEAALPAQAPISLRAAVDYAAVLLCREFHYPESDFSCTGGAGDSVIQGDPYALMQALQAVLLSFYDLRRRDSHLCVTLAPQGSDIGLTIEVEADAGNLALARRAVRILNPRRRTPRLVYDEDISLYNAAAYLELCGARPVATLCRSGGETAVRLKVRFPCCQEEPSAPRVPQPAAGTADRREKILLFSTSTAQIDILCEYLQTEPYVLYAFSSERDFCAFLAQGGEFDLVILNIFLFDDATKNICQRIRELYPLDQLPILAITQDSYRRLEPEIMQYVNDILPEPFGQADLAQKTYLLMLLRRSAKETLKAKIDFLQSQMDPHFIFNALSSIMPLCIADPPEAYRVLSDFSDYLRGRLYPRHLQTPIPLYEEMDVVEAFLSIERVRFPGRIECRVEGNYSKDDEILPLLVEPIVENCVQHGMRPDRDQILHLYIGIRELDGALHIVIRDDGNGIEEEQLQRMRGMDYVATSSIGFSNVKKRLMLYYHEKLSIESKKGSGTEVSFKIPLSRTQ